MHFRRYWAGMLCVTLAGALALGALAGCAKKAAPAAPPAPSKAEVATYVNNSEIIVFWDPSESGSNEIIALNNIYETLLYYNSGTGECDPVLATSFQVSPDGKTWTFDIRKGVKFHCGHAMDANAVKYSIERTKNGGKGASWLWDPVEAISVLDPYKVEFKLKFSSPLDVALAAGYGAHIMCPVCTEAKGHDYLLQGHAFGTGPYMIESWKQAEQELVLTRFPDYWRGWQGKHFDKVVFKTVPEAATRRQILEAGQADFTEMLPYEMVKAMEGNPKIHIEVTPSYQNMLGLINTQKGALKDKRVRQAICYAVPYSDIIQHVMYGYAEQSKGVIPHGLWGHDENLFQYSLDLDKARALLKEAGYGNGGLNLVMTYVAGDENERRAGELVKAKLAELGINLEVRGMPWEAQWDLAKAPKPEDRQDIFVFYWWPDNANPQSYLSRVFMWQEPIHFNLSYYKNPAFDALVQEGIEWAGADRARTIECYRKAQEMIIEDAAAIFFFDQSYVRPMRASFKGFKDNPAYPNVVFFYNTYREGE
ncbi:MAG: ABC transporter substrate-binding protein [Acetobacteraceae bacterium]|nr:ABC transporter substrate-binding protein [Acetobacteraceae bacterium]